MCEKKFTFAVMTYNQSDTIIQTLESIKYQVLNYGKNIPTKLIITEDCSRDDTLQKCKKWTAKNGQLFSEYVIYANDQNKGTVFNYLRILGEVGTESFKVIAGDDLFCFSNNLYDACTEVSDNCLKIGIPLYIQGNKITYAESRLVDIIYYMHKDITKGFLLNGIMRGGFFNTPSVLYNKKTVEVSNAREVLKKFRLFEDDPTWYSIAKNIDGLKLVFSYETFVLYRVSNSSVSNNRNRNNPFSEELKILHDVYKEAASPLTRILLYFQDSELPKPLRLDLYFKKIRDTYRKRYVMSKFRTEFDSVTQSIKTRVEIEQTHYDLVNQVEA